MGVSSDRIHPVKANAAEGLPFELEFFDAVVSIDSYNYFGRDSQYLGERLLPYVKSGGRIYLFIPGMVRDCHDALPACLLASWDAEQLEYMHDMAWWRDMIGQTSGVVIEDIHQMACTSELLRAPCTELTIYCEGIVYDSTNQVQLWSNLTQLRFR